MRAAGVAAAAGDADDVAGVDVLTDVDIRLDQLVAVAGDDAAVVVDVDVPAAAGRQVRVAVAVAAPVGAGTHVGRVAPHSADGAGCGGVDRGAFGDDQVDAVVAGPIHGAESGADLTVHRRGPPVAADGGAPAESGGDCGQRGDQVGGLGFPLGVRVG